MTTETNGESEAPAGPEAPRKIAVLGEIPFAGRALVQALLKNGLAARVLCPDHAAELAVRAAVPVGTPAEPATLPAEQRLELVSGSLESADAVAHAMKGCYGAVLLSPITMNGRMYRAAEHVDDVKRVAQAAEAGVIRKLVYHSALCANPESRSTALKDALVAEELVRGSRCEDFVVRTGPLMGRGDGFLTEIVSHMQKPGPFMSIWGYGATELQPLHVDDLARCLLRVIQDSGKDLVPGDYVLAGPELTTVMDLYDAVAERLGRFKFKLHAPLFVLRMLGASGGAAFREKLEMLFDLFQVRQNDMDRFLGRDAKLLTAKQAADEILAKGCGMTGLRINTGAETRGSEGS